MTWAWIDSSAVAFAVGRVGGAVDARRQQAKWWELCVPLPARHFDTVVMLACLNHVPESKRSPVLQEARRVLRDEGRPLITMINPVIGFFAHTIQHRHDPGQLERGIGEEEAKGLWDKEVKARLLAGNGFRLIQTVPFVFGLNHLSIAQKDAKSLSP